MVMKLIEFGSYPVSPQLLSEGENAITVFRAVMAVTNKNAGIAEGRRFFCAHMPVHWLAVVRFIPALIESLGIIIRLRLLHWHVCVPFPRRDSAKRGAG
jgi:hypothetical protein